MGIYRAKVTHQMSHHHQLYVLHLGERHALRFEFRFY